MRYLYENQGIDFDDVRADLGRSFGAGYSATVHDGDATTLFDRIAGFYAAGIITAASGAIAATFAIDYITEEVNGRDLVRHVVGVHIGPRGYWCRSQADLESYNEWPISLGNQACSSIVGES